MHETSLSLAAHMASVAEHLLGEPNQRLSSISEHRYGMNGSLSIDIETGRFYDHETKTGGGVLDLISRETHCDHQGAVLWMREHGFLEQQQSNGKSTSLGKEVAHYDYVDEDDKLLFQVVRFEPKTFRQRHKDSTGTWTWSVKGVRVVPYRLPDVIEAISYDRTVFIVEGEKDVENLRKIGLTGTCNPGGAGKWRAEMSEHFKGADVAILPDNDQAGQDHASSVATHLLGTAARIRVLNLAQHWPNMLDKADVSDWIKDGGGSSEALQALIEQTRDWSPVPFRSKFGGLRWEEIATLGHATGYTWLVEDIVPMGEISLVFGDSGSGKSFGTFDMSMAIARGLEWNGKHVEAGLVVYVAAEAGKGFGKRKLAYGIQHELPHNSSFPFYLCTKRPDFFCDDTDLILLIEEITAVCKTYSREAGADRSGHALSARARHERKRQPRRLDGPQAAGCPAGAVRRRYNSCAPQTQRGQHAKRPRLIDRRLRDNHRVRDCKRQTDADRRQHSLRQRSKTARRQAGHPLGVHASCDHRGAKQVGQRRDLMRGGAIRYRPEHAQGWIQRHQQ